jgi:hypothetical protein
MSNPAKAQAFTKQNIFEEIQSMYAIKNDNNSWNNCYFHRVKSDVRHDEGICMACDWKRHIDRLSKEKSENFDFIEAWDWPKHWFFKKEQREKKELA